MKLNGEGLTKKLPFLSLKRFLVRDLPAFLLVLLSFVVAIGGSALYSCSAISAVSKQIDEVLPNQEDSLFCEISNPRSSSEHYTGLGLNIEEFETKYYYTGSSVSYRAVFNGSEVNPTLSIGGQSFALSIEETAGIKDVNYIRPYIGNFQILKASDGITNWDFLTEKSGLGAIPYTWADDLLTTLGVDDYSGLLGSKATVSFSSGETQILVEEITIGAIYGPESDDEGKIDFAREQALFGKANLLLDSTSFADFPGESLCFETIKRRKTDQRAMFYQVVGSLVDDSSLSASFEKTVDSAVHQRVMDIQDSISTLHTVAPKWAIVLADVVIGLLCLIGFLALSRPLLQDFLWGTNLDLVCFSAAVYVSLVFLLASLIVKLIGTVSIFGVVGFSLLQGNLVLSAMTYLVWLFVTFLFNRFALRREKDGGTPNV
jgi:hypothetical protein